MGFNLAAGKLPFQGMRLIFCPLADQNLVFFKKERCHYLLHEAASENSGSTQRGTP